jgi:hypothetical protein
MAGDEAVEWAKRHLGEEGDKVEYPEAVEAGSSDFNSGP